MPAAKPLYYARMSSLRSSVNYARSVAAPRAGWRSRRCCWERQRSRLLRSSFASASWGRRRRPSGGWRSPCRPCGCGTGCSSAEAAAGHAPGRAGGPCRLRCRRAVLRRRPCRLALVVAADVGCQCDAAAELRAGVRHACRLSAVRREVLEAVPGRHGDRHCRGRGADGRELSISARATCSAMRWRWGPRCSMPATSSASAGCARGIARRGSWRGTGWSTCVVLLPVALASGESLIALHGSRLGGTGGARPVQPRARPEPDRLCAGASAGGVLLGRTAAAAGNGGAARLAAAGRADRLVASGRGCCHPRRHRPGATRHTRRRIVGENR